MRTRLQRFVPKHRVFKISYAVVAVLAGVIGYQTVHYSSAQSLPSGTVQLQMSKQNYVVGEVVKYTIVNGLPKTVSILNNCPNEPLEVFRMQQGSWVQIHATANPDKCVNEPRVYALTAGAYVSSSYLFWPSLFSSPGQYKVVVPIEGYSNGPYALFTIAN